MNNNGDLLLLMFLSYTVTLLVIFGYVAYLAARLRAISSQLKDLEKDPSDR